MDFSLINQTDNATSASSVAARGPLASVVPGSNSMKSFVELTHFHWTGSNFFDGSLQAHSHEEIFGIGPMLQNVLPVNEPVVGFTPAGATQITSGFTGFATQFLFTKHLSATSFAASRVSQPGVGHKGSVVCIVP